MTRRLQVLFLAALVGLLVVVGVVVGELAGQLGLAAYAGLAVAGLAVAARRARRAQAAAPPVRRPVQHCTCCDGDHTAPVKVI